MNAEEFEANYTQILDTLLKAFANSSEVKPEKFYNLAGVIENLHYINDVVFDVINSSEETQQ